MIAKYSRTRAPYARQVLRRGADEARLDYNLAVPLREPQWRTLIEACIAHEFGAWDRLRQPA